MRKAGARGSGAHKRADEKSRYPSARFVRRHSVSRTESRDELQERSRIRNDTQLRDDNAAEDAAADRTTSSERRRRKRIRVRRAPVGASPGTLIADPEAPKPVLTVFAYGPDELVESKVEDLETLRPLCAKFPVVWLNCDGLGDARVIEKIGEVFGLHRLALEDVLNTHQRPKVEAYGDDAFIVLRMLDVTARPNVETEQLAMFLGKDFLVSFQERPGDGFDAVRARLRAGRAKGLLRKSGPDYLCYALLDAAIDEYFPLLETIGGRLDEIEQDILERPRPACMRELHITRRDLLTLRRAVWPLREAVGSLLREAVPHFRPETRLYLNDCYDHTVQLIDLLETYRELATGIQDIYLSMMSHRLNEVMKVLTLIATIFIPITFISSVYGMNFDTSVSRWNMPELEWRYGYLACLALMLAVAVGFLLFFRRKGWIGSGDAGEEP